MMDLERIAVYYMSKDGGDWALYLQSKLNTKDYSIETVLNDLNCDSVYHTKSARLNVFLITPDFLDNYQLGTFFGRFEKSTSLLILTGTERADVIRQTEAYQCQHILEWLIHELSADDESVRELMLTIIGIYEGHVDVHMEQQTSDNVDSVYDTLPKARQVNKVHEVLQKNDKVYLMLERLPEGQITIHFPLDKIKPNFLSRVAVFAFDCSDIEDTEFKVVQEGDKIGEGKIKVSSDHVYESTPKSFSTIGTQTGEQILDENANTNNDYDNEYLKPPRPHKPKPVTPDSAPKSRLEQIRELLEAETDPVRLLCDCFGIEKNVQKLDETLASMVESAETLKHLSLLVKNETKEESADVVWPSLLHFGAEFNLVNFCDVLLSNQLMYNCCSMTNKDGRLPHQLAQLRGHTDLAEMLKQFLNYIRTSKYDSGISTDTPRLSTISQQRDSDGSYTAPPVPHMISYVGRYLNQMKEGEDEEGDDYINEAEVRKVREKQSPNRQNLSMLSSSTRSLSDSIQEEPFEDEHLLDELSPLPSPHDSVFYPGSIEPCIPEEGRPTSVQSPFGNIMDISKHPAYGSNPLSRSVTDPVTLYASQVSDPHHRRKNIVSHLGIQSPGSEVFSSSPDEHKRKGFLSLFKSKPKNRSKSDPCFPKGEFDQHLRQKKETHYKRGNPDQRSSGTSSGSTASTLSIDSRDDEDSQSVDLRNSGKSKKNLKQMLLSKRRKSIRMKNVLKDANLSGPKLPSRKETVAEFF